MLPPADPSSVLYDAEKAVAASFVGFLQTLNEIPDSCSWHLGECSKQVIRQIFQEYRVLDEQARVRLLDNYLQRFYFHCVLSDCSIVTVYRQRGTTYSAENPDQVFTCLLSLPGYRGMPFSTLDRYRYGEAVLIEKLKTIALNEFQDSYRSVKTALVKEFVQQGLAAAFNPAAFQVTPKIAQNLKQLELLFLRYHCQLDLLEKKANAPGYIASAWKVAVSALGGKKAEEPAEGVEFTTMPNSKHVFYALNPSSSGWFGSMLPSRTCGWLKIRLNAENILFLPFNLHPSIAEPIPPAALLDVRKGLQGKDIPLAVIMDVSAALDNGIPGSAYPARKLTTANTQPYTKTLTPHGDMTLFAGIMQEVLKQPEIPIAT
ncbi:MAG: hypothetical protein LLG04_06745 [Parachlamydia sp.]|nr:hypothetical protein [Parachlamydia sp.]